MNIEPMSYEEIVAQISPLSNNSADHDVEFARRILAARDAQYAAMAWQEPVAWTGVDVGVLLKACGKPEEIAGDATVQHDRVRELLHWFVRFQSGAANPKWLREHSAELAYYIATGAMNRTIDLKAVREAAFQEGVNIDPKERAMLQRILPGKFPTHPAPTNAAAQERAEPVAPAAVHQSDCSTNNRGVPELLGPCDCSQQTRSAFEDFANRRYAPKGYQPERDGDGYKEDAWQLAWEAWSEASREMDDMRHAYELLFKENGKLRSEKVALLSTSDFDAQTAPEAYLQQEIRALSATLPAPAQPLASSDPEGHRQAIADHEAGRAQPSPNPSKPEQAEAPSGGFIVKTNREYAAWCATHYNPDALDERGMVSLHGLWAWQEQERRKASTLPPASAAGEREAAFKEGAKAFFDALLYRAANHWHGNKAVNEQCQKDNKLIQAWAADALQEVDPDDYSEWLSITELTEEIRKLKAALATKPQAEQEAAKKGGV